MIALERRDPNEVLEITASDRGDMRLLHFAGEFDMAGVERFQRLLTQGAPSEIATFVLDMRDLSFIDSSGLRAVIMADDRVRAQGGRIVVVRGPQRVNEVMEITGVARQIEVVDEPPAS